MALTASQQKFAQDLAILVGVILKEVPDQADVTAYVTLIKQEIDTIVAQPGAPTTKEIGDAALNVVTDVVDLIPNTTPGEKKFHNFTKLAVGFVKVFGL